MEKLLAWLRARSGVRLFLTWFVLVGGGLAAALGERPLFRVAGVVLTFWGGLNFGLVIAERERMRRERQE